MGSSRRPEGWRSAQASERAADDQEGEAGGDVGRLREEPTMKRLAVGVAQPASELFAEHVAPTLGQPLAARRRPGTARAPPSGLR